MQLMTASRAKCARACQRKHKLRYIDGFRSVQDSEALRFGSLIHLCLEHWFLAPEGVRLDHALAALRDAAECDPLDRAKAYALLLGYDTRWAEVTMEVIAVEKSFQTDLVNPETKASSRTWQLAGKLDAVVRINGRLLVVEHKTSSEDVTPGSNYWKRLRIDGQVSTYFIGSASLGYAVDACLYDVIKKPALRPYKATPEESRKYTKDGNLYANQRDRDETAEEYQERLITDIAEKPTEYFSRGEVVRLESEIKEAMYDDWQLTKQLQESRLAARYPRNPDACVMYGQTCEFFGVCCGEASLEDQSLFLRQENVHPELETA